MFAPEFSDARMSWAKHAYLAVVVDDFFDVEGSLTEIKILIGLVEKWDVNIGSTDCCSEQVQILFAAIHSTILETALKASNLQGRNVTSHIIEIWLYFLYAMLEEAKWTKSNLVPSLEEYMASAHISFALGITIFPALYFVGSKLPEAVVQHSEFCSLYKLVSTCGRLMNDIQGCQRESGQGKPNAISLLMIHKGISEAEAIVQAKGIVRDIWRKVLRLVVEEEGSVVSREFKDVFWNMSRVMQLFYMKEDGLSTNGLKQLVKSIIYEQVSPPTPVK